jgi:hypothetical protein
MYIIPQIKARRLGIRKKLEKLENADGDVVVHDFLSALWLLIDLRPASYPASNANASDSRTCSRVWSTAAPGIATVSSHWAQEARIRARQLRLGWLLTIADADTVFRAILVELLGSTMRATAVSYTAEMIGYFVRLIPADAVHATTVPLCFLTGNNQIYGRGIMEIVDTGRLVGDFHFLSPAPVPEARRDRRSHVHSILQNS